MRCISNHFFIYNFSKFQTKRSAKFRFKADNLEDGVLLYAVENEKTYGDFIAIILKDGYVELRYSVAGSTCV